MPLIKGWTVTELSRSGANGQGRVVAEFSDGAQIFQRTYIDDSPSDARLSAWARAVIAQMDGVSAFAAADPGPGTPIDIGDPPVDDAAAKRDQLIALARYRDQLTFILGPDHADVLAADADVQALYTKGDIAAPADAIAAVEAKR